MISQAVKTDDPKSGKNSRYVYRHGIVLADDFVKSAMEKSVLPLDGAYIIRLKKPLPCVFITFGYGGIMLPDNGLCVIGDSWNQPNKEESFALHRLMQALDPDYKYKIKSNWVLVDMKETDARVIRRPTEREIATMKKTPTQMKMSESAVYKAIKRIQRRKTTSGADIPDGHEGDSDRDPIDVLFDEMAIREKKNEKARLARLAPWPDTEFGRQMHKEEMERKRLKETAAADDPTADIRPPARKRGRPPGRRLDKKSSGATARTVSAARPAAAPPLQPYEDLFGENSEGEGRATSQEAAIVQMRRTAASKTAPRQGPQTEPPGSQPLAAASLARETSDPTFDSDDEEKEKAVLSDVGDCCDEDEDRDHGEIDYGD